MAKKKPASRSGVKPIIVLPPDAMDKANIAMLRRNGICVVICQKPEQVRFVEAPIGSQDRCERAAVSLFRHIASRTDAYCDRSKLLATFAKFVVAGTELDPVPAVKINQPQSAE